MSYTAAQVGHDRHSQLLAALAQHAQEQQARNAHLGTDRLTMRVRQTGHGFAAGDVVRHDGSSWTKAQADTAAHAAAGGVVEKVNGDRFRLVLAGRIRGLSGLTAGQVHYLSAASAGALTTTAPALAVPILRALSTTEAVVAMQLAVSGPSHGSYSTSGSISSGYGVVLTASFGADRIPFGTPFTVDLWSAYEGTHTPSGSVIAAGCQHMGRISVPSQYGTATEKWISRGQSAKQGSTLYSDAGIYGGSPDYPQDHVVGYQGDWGMSYTTDANGVSAVTGSSAAMSVAGTAVLMVSW